MSKGTGKFLGRGSFTIHTVKNHLRPGDLIRCNDLPDKGVYEVECSWEPYYIKYGVRALRARRIDMRYLTGRQRGRVIDLSSRLGVSVMP